MKIGIVEDEGLTNDLLVSVCRKEFGAEVVVRETRGEPGLAGILAAKPALVILDISLPDMDGLDVATEVRAQLTECRVMILSAMQDPLTMLRVKALGLHGFVPKRDISVTVLVEAIREVSAGRRYLSPVVERVLAEARKETAAFHLLLTEPEKRLLIYIGNACTDEEIAAFTGFRETTVQSRRRDIMHKLDIHSTPKLIQFAAEMGFARLGLYLPNKLRRLQ